MEIESVDFQGSFPRVNQCPEGDLPEYAFIGRSNVGKSSLINLLCNRKEVARVSNKPGKTQHFNFFLINKSWHMVDLPGYGYAKISKKQREKWAKELNKYLKSREQLYCLFLLIDGSIPPQKKDLEFIDRLGQLGVPFVLVFTKTDKAKPAEVETFQTQYKEILLESWESLPDIFHTSTVKGTGREDLLTFISGINLEHEQVAHS
ncbi:MAG: YihA family ribosome biogenesis GTP-binding protein [Saprospiraceae bacterium]|nr:YihA family ribosome biogenesis GTP-binding protein [Saprospiraceae bacterium]